MTTWRLSPLALAAALCLGAGGSSTLAPPGLRSAECEASSRCIEDAQDDFEDCIEEIQDELPSCLAGCFPGLPGEILFCELACELQAALLLQDCQRTAGIAQFNCNREWCPVGGHIPP